MQGLGLSVLHIEKKREKKPRMLLSELTMHDYFSFYRRTCVLSTSYLVAAGILQCLWSLALALAEIYALLVKRSLINVIAISIFSVGDGVSHIFSGS
jgi:hypothetical protein